MYMHSARFVGHPKLVLLCSFQFASKIDDNVQWYVRLGTDACFKCSSTISMS